MTQDTDAANLFDDNVDVEIASMRSQHSRRVSSSEASRPPTSESEGMFDHSLRGNSSGEDSEGFDNDSEDLPVHISISSRKSKEVKSAQVGIHIIIIMFKLY